MSPEQQDGRGRHNNCQHTLLTSTAIWIFKDLPVLCPIFTGVQGQRTFDHSTHPVQSLMKSAVSYTPCIITDEICCIIHTLYNHWWNLLYSTHPVQSLMKSTVLYTPCTITDEICCIIHTLYNHWWNLLYYTHPVQPLMKSTVLYTPGTITDEIYCTLHTRYNHW